ncbi:hypothetical protein [Streptomyces microflavus]
MHGARGNTGDSGLTVLEQVAAMAPAPAAAMLTTFDAGSATTG